VIKIPQSIYDRIKAQALAEAPNECCGYLAGLDGEVQEIIPMRNADASPEHFSFVPEEQFAALEKAAAKGVELFSVYHSHPATPPRMSDEDIRLAYDTSIIYLIYSMLTDELKAFQIDAEKNVTETSIDIIDEPH
jgi:proteasome lid subunit RPN8/RPN11